MRMTRHGSIVEGRFVRHLHPSGWAKALLGVLLTFVCGGGVRGDVTVTVTDLGTLPGHLGNFVQGIVNGRERGAVNGAGQVVGISAPPSGWEFSHGFSWTAAGGMVDLTLGGDRVGRLAVNEAGLVAGSGTTASGEEHAFSWTAAGGIVDLTPGDREGYVINFNEAGQVIGSRTTWSEMYGFSWTAAGGRVDFMLGGVFSQVTDVNEAGQVVGWGWTGVDSRGFLWSAAGGMTDLGPYVYPAAVSETGQVVGKRYDLSTNVTQAFFWSATGGMVDLGTFGGVESSAQDVSDTGQVIGEFFTATGVVHAFSWTAAGGMVDLTLGGSRSFAVAVTNGGQVIGNGSTAGDANYHAFSWTADGGMVVLTLGGSDSEVIGVNRAGQVIGRVWSPEDHGFSWTPAGGMIDFGPDSKVTAVNEAGQVVGYALIPGMEVEGPHPFSWAAAGGVVDLGPPLNSGHRLFVSETGLVAGTRAADGSVHGVLFTIGGSGGGGGGGDEVDTLVAELAAFIDGLDVKHGQRKSALRRLEKLLEALDADKKNSTKKACHELDKLLKQVSGRAFMRNLTADEEAELVDRIVAIQAVIGC